MPKRPISADLTATEVRSRRLQQLADDVFFRGNEFVCPHLLRPISGNSFMSAKPTSYDRDSVAAIDGREAEVTDLGCKPYRLLVENAAIFSALEAGQAVPNSVRRLRWNE